MNDGRFKKGIVPWNKKQFEPLFCLTCEKKITTKGAKRFCSSVCYGKSLIGQPKVGHSFTEEVKQVIADKIKQLWTDDTYRSHMVEAHIGKMAGDKNPRWMGGIGKNVSYWNKLRRQRWKDAPGEHTEEQWQALKAEHDFTCLRCKKKEPEIKLNRDHIVPLASGGTNDIENIQPLCKPCNSYKHAKTINYIYANPELR